MAALKSSLRAVRELIGPELMTKTQSDVLWVYENGKMVNREIWYVPAIYRIFDAMLLYAADINNGMDPLYVDIDVQENAIEVLTRGVGRPAQTKSWFFGHLLLLRSSSSSEEADKLAVLLSCGFVIDTAYMGQRSTQSLRDHTTSSCDENEKWTKISFLPNLQMFGMARLDGDIVGLMKRRAVDLAGTLGTTVVLNKQALPVKDFTDYVNLYLQTSPHIPRVFLDDGGTWEICISRSNGQFKQVSFVNHIATIKGGTHVDYVADKIIAYVMKIVNNKNANLEAHTVKNHLWVFLKSKIDNPSFDDSQTKETLTTPPSRFWSKCELSDFMRKARKSGLLQMILSSAGLRQRKAYCTEKESATGINGIYDAIHAGGRNSDKCTLILSVGSSGNRLAMDAIAFLGQSHYGVYPLRRKLLNIAETSPKKSQYNAEIQNIMKIIGLKPEQNYDDSVNPLRYGRLMIIANQDEDKSCFTAQLINFFYLYWPSLLKNTSLISVLTTPIVKGLIEKTSIELQVYFNAIDKHKIDLVWKEKQDDALMELAFGKKTEERKKWLHGMTKLEVSSVPSSEQTPGTHLDQKKQISYILNKDPVWKETQDHELMVLALRKVPEQMNKWRLQEMTKSGVSSIPSSEQTPGTHLDQNKQISYGDSINKDSAWREKRDDELMELARSKKYEEGTWLHRVTKFLVSSAPSSSEQTPPGGNQKQISYSDFLNKDLILSLTAGLKQLMPSVVDGLNSEQRKILFCSFKMKIVDDKKEFISLPELCSYVNDHLAYPHPEATLESTIIGMTHNFVGSNNINLLMLSGPFESCRLGGKEARSLGTKLSPITSFLFPKEDDIFLGYLKAIGESIEPDWYMPVIPPVLINGSGTVLVDGRKKIGSGCSTYIPNYNPKDIVRNVRRLLNGEKMFPMEPWYKGFRGKIEKSSATDECGCWVSYTSTGIIEEINRTTLHITELPVGRWTEEDYYNFLMSLVKGNKKAKNPFIDDVINLTSDETGVHFEVRLSEEDFGTARNKGLKEKFELTSTISTDNMYLFDSEGNVKHYESPEAILEDFFAVRLKLYEDWKNAQVANLKLESKKLESQVELIHQQLVGEDCLMMRADVLVDHLREKGFYEDTETLVPAGIPDYFKDEEVKTEHSNIVFNLRAVDGCGFVYLLSMPDDYLSFEGLQTLKNTLKKVKSACEEMEKEDAKSLWRKDLDALESQLVYEAKKISNSSAKKSSSSSWKGATEKKGQPRKRAGSEHESTSSSSSRKGATKKKGRH